MSHSTKSGFSRRLALPFTSRRHVARPCEAITEARSGCQMRRNAESFGPCAGFGGAGREKVWATKLGSWSRCFLPVPFSRCSGAFSPLWSRPAGVGQFAAWLGSGVPPAPKLWFGPPFSPSEPRGVFHVVACPSSVGRSAPFFPPCRVYSPAATRGVIHVVASRARQAFPALLVGVRAVGHDEDPLSLVRCACFCRCEQTSRRRVTQSP